MGGSGSLRRGEGLDFPLNNKTRCGPVRNAKSAAVVASSCQECLQSLLQHSIQTRSKNQSELYLLVF